MQEQKENGTVMKIDALRLRALVKAHELTNANLAAKAGITRQALQVMLRGNGVIKCTRSDNQGIGASAAFAGRKRALTGSASRI